jgi:hypothetical protein
VVIAHSHGGNVTARAFDYLDSKISDLQVCYLGTPFLELFPRAVGKTERFILATVATLFFFFVGFIPFAILVAHIHKFIYGSVGHHDWALNILLFFSIMAGRGVYLWTASKRSQTRNEELVQAATVAEHDRSHGDSLILRAIDDEASLALAFGTIANLLAARLTFTLTLLLLALMAVDAALDTFGYQFTDTDIEVLKLFTNALFILVPVSLLAVASRSVFGRELLYYPPGIQMNMQSVPDHMRSAEIRTLLRGGSSLFFALRHGVYSHPNASDVVADWICAHPPPIKHLTNSAHAAATRSFDS